MTDTLHPGDRVVVTQQDVPGREHWVGMPGTVQSVDDPVEDLYPVLVKLDSLALPFHFAGDELRLLYAAGELVGVARG